MTPGRATYGPGARLVVVDMQRMFVEDTPWRVLGAGDIAANLLRLARHRPERTLCSRFITPRNPDDAPPAWRAFYRRWPAVTLERMPAAMLDLAPPLAELAAEVCDKTTFSCFGSGPFGDLLRRRGADTLILAGVETDSCVLATALSAIDRGFEVVIAVDAVASASPAAHAAVLDVLLPRLDPLVRLATTDNILAAWA